MTQQQLQNLIRGPLVANLGNKLTPELVAGLMASIAEVIIKNMVDTVAEEKDSGI